MQTANESIQVLTDPSATTDRKRDAANTFSRHFGWRPNDFFDVPNALPTANLVVEHGLDNAAMLSFLPSDRALEDIHADETLRILGLSYNSLVDWHVWIDGRSVRYYYNRADPPQPLDTKLIADNGASELARQVFDEAVGHAPNPNVLALDGALLDTISTWKRALHLELGPLATPVAVSSLFNAIILARAVEDMRLRSGTTEASPTLAEIVADGNIGIADAISRSIVERAGPRVSPDLFDRHALEPFDKLSRASVSALVRAFYRHDSVPYQYDFSVISKHALSRIYERYVAVMQHEEPIQFSLFPSAREEAWNKQLGGIYTPQYIASFFAKYLQRELPRGSFLEASVLDPACGSGVFLRAVMEQKLIHAGEDPYRDAGKALNSLLGVDVDENAVASSRLSLALLYLAARGELPDEVPVIHDDSFHRFASSQGQSSTDAVMANPPFVRTESQSKDVRKIITEHVGSAAKGKLDTYLAFLVFSIRALKPGGFGFFVVPQPLLSSDNLKSLRNWIRQEAWVRVIADLSAIRVFRANVYVALLVVQKKGIAGQEEPPVGLIRCQRDVGLALEDFLDGIHRRTSSYFIFESPQAALSRPTWSVSTPEESSLLGRLEAMPSLNDVAVVRQGAITGNDDVFIIDAADVPPEEEDIYKPLLPDRMIGRYALPEETGLRIFYPYLNATPTTVPQLKEDFPITWRRLIQNRPALASRRSIATARTEWWRPIWPRSPHEMLVPKIVMPEVSLLPRFGLDTSGHWVVSHSPYVRARRKLANEDLLYVLTAVLNSSVSSWFIDLNARKYRGGYNKVGVALLRRLPIPDLRHVSRAQLSHIVALVRELVDPASDIDSKTASILDDMVLADLYRLSDEEISIVRPEAPVR